MLSSILTDRRVWLLGLTLGLVWVLTRWTLPMAAGLAWIVNAGYWVLLFLFVLFGRALWAVLRANGWATKVGRFDIAVAALVLGVVTFWTVHEKPGYKILADELMLSSAAMGMHYERTAACPLRATDVKGSFQILERAVDKRPLAYPFLVATVHDLTGYRPANAFWVNIGLAVVLLGLIYVLGRRVTGQRWAGVAGVLLCAGLPLLAQQATGGGFELLNLVLLVGFVLLVAEYLREPNTPRLEALVFGALLLAATRYESALFLVPVAVTAAIGWWRAGKVVLSWPLQLSPIFLGLLLLQNRVFAENAKAWQMSGRSDATAPFGLTYLPDNLGHALAFFFDFSGYLTNSPLIAALGLLALPFTIVYVWRVVREPRRAEAADLAWTVAALSLLAITLLLLLYFWGQFDDPIISRLSLPVHLLLLLSVFVAGKSIAARTTAWKFLAGLAAVGLLYHGIPVIARQAYRTSYGPGMEMQARGDFLRGLSDRNVLFIDRDSFFWILHKIPATPVQQAQLRREGLAYHLRNRSFQDMFVYQRVMVDEQTSQPAVVPEDELGPEFELETVFERRILTRQFARISRIVAIVGEGQNATRSRRFVEPVDEPKPRDGLEKSGAAYLENWIKHLP